MPKKRNRTKVAPSTAANIRAGDNTPGPVIDVEAPQPRLLDMRYRAIETIARGLHECAMAMKEPGQIVNVNLSANNITAHGQTAVRVH